MIHTCIIIHIYNEYVPFILWKRKDEKELYKPKYRGRMFYYSLCILFNFFFPVLYLMSLEHLILFSFFFSFLVSCKGLFEKAFQKWNGCYPRNFSPRIKSPKSLGSSTDQFMHPFSKSYDNSPLRMYKLLTKVLGCEVSDVALSNPRIWENMAWVYCIESTVYWGCTIL